MCPDLVLASALMARLPESERDELVTKAYLDERLDLFRAEMNARVAELEASLTRQMHSSFRISLGAHATTLLAVLAILATR